MSRTLQKLSVTIDSGTAVSEAINMAKYAGGMIIMPAAWTTADLGFQVCGSDGGTFVKLADRENGYGTDVSIDAAAAATAYPLPAFIFAAPWVKLWSHDGAGSGVNQAADRVILLYLKD